jgi:ABC-type uncharacterized transport system auxiliary subunit
MRPLAARALAFVPLCLIFLGAGGCALLTKDDPLIPRYFSPGAETATDTAAPTAAATSAELRLGRVNSSAFIREQVVHRDGAHELGSYESIRWSEKPETYVRRALAHAIFDRRGVREVISGPATTLDVDVVTFEEVRGPPHVGTIRLDYRLLDDRVVRFARSVVVSRPIGDAKGAAAADAIVAALAEALGDAVEIVAQAATDSALKQATAAGAPARP